MDQREVRILDQSGSDQRKHIIFEQEDHIKQSRADECKNTREENLALRKCPEG